MLSITIQGRDYYNEQTKTFESIPSETIQINHSLVAVSKWESRWLKPFLTKDKKTKEETIDYIRCMTITENVNSNIYNFITNDIFDQIEQYIDAPMTATWFAKSNQPPNKEVITSELIYYWMIAQNIPVEFQHWHLTRLLTLIRVCGAKNSPSKKMSRREMIANRRAQNIARRNQLNSKG